MIVSSASRRASLLLPLLACWLTAGLVSAQEPVEQAAGGLRPELSWGLEAKAHLRDSEETRIPVALPDFVVLPPGEQAFLETANAGTHGELSVVTLFADAVWGPALAAHLKIDFIDLHERNPTSEDHRVDVDEAWIRFGREREPAVLPERPGVYLKVGKMPHFERQNDRHLESYGLISTAFNRLEDVGLELGADLGRHLYLRASVTQGNPVFFRDPNALAGDNGTPPFASGLPSDAQTPIKSGFLILYDAEVEDFSFDGDPEIGAGVGVRFGDLEGEDGVDFLVWGYRRKLAETVPLEGTFYGGDLDLLRGPLNMVPLAIRGDEKEELGANLWIYWRGFSLFAQYVDQEIAGLPRTGYETELAWNFDLPVVWGLAGRQLFPSIQPVVRYSKLDPDFDSVRGFPAPSITWDWEKIDYGVRIGIIPGVDLTAELADNTFTLASGRDVSADEVLATLRWKM